MLYTGLKYLHIVLAIVAVGFNASYGLILGRAQAANGDGREMRFALRTVQVMDDYVANPCYVLLLLTGIGMVHAAGYPWSLLWIWLSLALLAALAVIGFGFYTPTLRRQIAAFDAGGQESAEFRRLSKAGALQGAVLGVIVLVIVGLMVFKPA